MGMTITEKILANRAEGELIEPGRLVSVHLDLVLGTDATLPLALQAFRRMGATKVWNKDQTVFVLDHYEPAHDAAAAEAARAIRAFAETHGITNVYDPGNGGISHVVLPEEGFVVPGDIVVGADTHTCTYGALGAFATGVGSTDLAAAIALGEVWLRVPESIKVEITGSAQPWVGGKDIALRVIQELGAEKARYRAVELLGEAIDKLPLNHRMTLCNMIVEAGAKNAVIVPDESTLNWIRPRARRNVRLFRADLDAAYAETLQIDIGGMPPLVACPPSAANVKPVDKLEQIQIDQVVIGTCSSGMFEDLRAAATLLQGQKVNRKVRLLVIPGSRSVLRQALKEGVVSALVEAGAVILPTACGPCASAQSGLLAKDETALVTSAVAYPGCMGHPESRVYLASPAVAAATAITGIISDPRDIKRPA